MPTINSFIRFLHASPGVHAVDIYTDENLVIENLAYNEIADYLPVEPGNIRIQVFAAGKDGEPLLDTVFDLPSSEMVTLALTGTVPEVSLLPIFFNVEVATHNDGLIRFAHLSPATPALDLAVTGDLRFTDVEYKEVTGFEAAVPGSYNLELRLAGEEEVLLAETLNVMERKAYTVYAVGLLGEEPPLEISYYKDQIPYVDDTVKKTEFRKEFPNRQPPQVNFVYR